jgi:Arc/MetJ-type ribon-helix-helix transcriptional regulator
VTGQHRPYFGFPLRQLAVARTWSQYDSSMSDPKARLTITVDPRLSAYAEELVRTGRAPSVSAVFNDALAEKEQRDRHALEHLREIAARADRSKVSRMAAHVEAQAAALRNR